MLVSWSAEYGHQCLATTAANVVQGRARGWLFNVQARMWHTSPMLVACSQSVLSGAAKASGRLCRHAIVFRPDGAQKQYKMLLFVALTRPWALP
jgi:hypothetical protein